MKNRQSRIQSFAESLMNVIIGYLIALLTQITVFPLFDIYVSVDTHIAIGVIFTGVSLIRSYVIRRVFNKL